MSKLTSISLWLNRWIAFANQDIELSKQEYLSLAKWCFWIGVPAHIGFALHFDMNMNLNEDWYWRLGIVFVYVLFFIGVNNKFYADKLKHVHRYLWLAFSIVQLIYLPMHLYMINNYDIMWLTSFPFFALMLLATIKSFDLFWAGGLGLLSALIFFKTGAGSRMDIVASLYMAPLCVGGYAMIYVRNLQRQALDKAALIEDAYNKLKEYEIRKDDFVASVAHEIRTPLSIATSGVEDIIATLSGSLACTVCNANVLKSCSMVTASLQNIRSQIHDLIEAEKLSRSNIVLSKQTVDLDTWVTSVSEKLQAMCKTKSLLYTCTLGHAGITSIFDPIRMETVLTNLVSNAVKFTPARGSVSVTIDTTDNHELMFVVEDTGCGIAAQDLPFIFDKYYQANESNCLGIGLGLSLVRVIVGAHDGRISVLSSKNKGTKMTVVIGMSDLPTIQSGPIVVGSDESSFDPGKYYSNNALIFIVEDNHVMLNVLSKYLSKHYSVLGFGTAEHALEALVLHTPVLVVCDINLPSMSGIDLLLRMRTVQPDLPFMFVTAHANAYDMLASYKNVVVVEKPFLYKDIDNAIIAMMTDKP